MIGYYNYTVILTYLGLASGITSVFYAVTHHPVLSIMFLMIAGLCDAFDGFVARTKERTENEKKFGVELDSLADMVCYGIVPAVFGYCLGYTKWYCLIAFIIYPLAALIRLAYFNVSELNRQAKNTTGCRTYYEGLPVTTVSLIIPLFYPVIAYFKNFSALLYSILLTITAYLFLAKIKVPKFKLKGLIVLVLIGILEFVVLKLFKIYLL